MVVRCLFGGGWGSSLSRQGLMEFLGGVRKLCGGGQAMEDHIVICGHEGWFSIFIRSSFIDVYWMAGFWEHSSLEVWQWFCGLWLAVNGLWLTVCGKSDQSLATCVKLCE